MYNDPTMQYLIDGHNLIPKLGGSLDTLDDEDQLIHRLQEFARLSRARLEVYFDGAPPGHASTRAAGSVRAHFVRKGSTADAAIEARLGKLARQARMWTVVSSDHRVQQAARAAHAQVLTSEQFASTMSKTFSSQGKEAKSEATLPPEEVEEWLEEFETRRRRDNNC